MQPQRAPCTPREPLAANGSVGVADVAQDRATHVRCSAVVAGRVPHSRRNSMQLCASRLPHAAGAGDGGGAGTDKVARGKGRRLAVCGATPRCHSTSCRVLCNWRTMASALAPGAGAGDDADATAGGNGTPAATRRALAIAPRPATEPQPQPRPLPARLRWWPHWRACRRGAAHGGEGVSVGTELGLVSDHYDARPPGFRRREHTTAVHRCRTRPRRRH